MQVFMASQLHNYNLTVTEVGQAINRPDLRTSMLSTLKTDPTALAGDFDAWIEFIQYGEKQPVNRYCEQILCIGAANRHHECYQQLHVHLGLCKFTETLHACMRALAAIMFNLGIVDKRCSRCRTAFFLPYTCKYAVCACLQGDLQLVLNGPSSTKPTMCQPSYTQCLPFLPGMLQRTACTVIPQSSAAVHRSYSVLVACPCFSQFCISAACNTVERPADILTNSNT